MQQSFINHHITIFLSSLSRSNEPLDSALGRYFRSHKALGSKDRKIMGDTVFGMARWKSLIDYFRPEDRLSFYQTLDWKRVLNDPQVPQWAKVGLTPYLYKRLCQVFGEEGAEMLGNVLNEGSPITIRVNTLKTDRETLLRQLQKRFNAIACPMSEVGIQFLKREPLFATEEFKEGLFEVQDEGSQLVALSVKARPGDIVLDYCSGAGGKALALGTLMQNKGQIYLHDVRLHALAEARKRLKRAGLQNAQCLEPGHGQLPRLIHKCDWVLADVPCSGTGTLRRNPEQKGKIDEEMVGRLVKEQKAIAQKALQYVKKGGRFVYATCSILPEENEAQANFFLQNFPLKLEAPPLAIVPKSGGPDGFFCAVFTLCDTIAPVQDSCDS